jgi:hypothetical protein
MHVHVCVSVDLTNELLHKLIADWHELRKAKVGFPISHDQHSYEIINWKVGKYIIIYTTLHCIGNTLILEKNSVCHFI